MSELLSSITEVARQVFGAASCSIALHDSGAHELVFVAVCGPEAEELIGSRFKTTSGIAGQVASSGEPQLVDDLRAAPAFAVDIATETGYLPERIMAAPLLAGDGTRGVISVLDRDLARPAAQDLELLLAFARQAAIVARMHDAARRASLALEDLNA
jgi:GAF domain-containing protein